MAERRREGSVEDDSPPSSPRELPSAGLRRVGSGSIAIPAPSTEDKTEERLVLVGPSSLLPQPSVADAERQARLTPEDFELLSLVGQGAFGKVFQVKKRSSGRIYAMKVMRKVREHTPGHCKLRHEAACWTRQQHALVQRELLRLQRDALLEGAVMARTFLSRARRTQAHVVEKNQAEYMRTERDVLTRVDHPYIVTLHHSFQTASKLYLLFDFVNGGHLFFQRVRCGSTVLGSRCPHPQAVPSWHL